MCGWWLNFIFYMRWECECICCCMLVRGCICYFFLFFLSLSAFGSILIIWSRKNNAICTYICHPVTNTYLHAHTVLVRLEYTIRHPMAWLIVSYLPISVEPSGNESPNKKDTTHISDACQKRQKITDAKSNLRFAFFRIPKFGLLIICAYNVWLMRVYCWNINWMAYAKKNWTIKLTFDAISYSRSWRWFFSLRMSMQCDGECGPLSIFHCITYFSFWLPWIPQFNFSLTFIEIVADPFFPANFPT